nr:hypothetical protein Iba_chr02eCG6660 [Ipomoea batatas]
MAEFYVEAEVNGRVIIAPIVDVRVVITKEDLVKLGLGHKGEIGDVICGPKFPDDKWNEIFASGSIEDLNWSRFKKRASKMDMGLATATTEQTTQEGVEHVVEEDDINRTTATTPRARKVKTSKKKKTLSISPCPKFMKQNIGDRARSVDILTPAFRELPVETSVDIARSTSVGAINPIAKVDEENDIVLLFNDGVAHYDAPEATT